MSLSGADHELYLNMRKKVWVTKKVWALLSRLSPCMITLLPRAIERFEGSFFPCGMDTLIWLLLPWCYVNIYVHNGIYYQKGQYNCRVVHSSKWIFHLLKSTLLCLTMMSSGWYNCFNFIITKHLIGNPSFLPPHFKVLKFEREREGEK